MAEEIYEQASRSRSSIFYNIYNTGTSLSSIVDDWIESYKKDNANGLLSLLQFFIDSSGCKGEITRIEDDFTDIIRELTKNFKEAGSDYPIIQTGRKGKLFKSNFGSFLQCLIKECQNSLLYDGYMMPKVINLLIGLSDSQVRAFRHTSTFGAMKIMTALTSVYKNMTGRKVTSCKQYEIESKKPPVRRSEQKMIVLKDTIEELDENLMSLHYMLRYLFKGVFVHRYRDSVSDIRIVCITELGVWMVKMPDLFLDDSHLKYIAWSLNDKAAGVRKCSLLSIQSIFEANNLYVRMELFVLKCKDRIVSMSFDVDPLVAVEAVKLISVLNTCFNNVFTNKDLECIYQLVFGENVHVAQAAGGFLSKKISEIINSRSVCPLSGNKITSYGAIIKELINFFIQSELHEHAAYLVDSLLDSCHALKDWECMTNFLLNEGGETLNLEEERVLIDMMVCSIKQCITGAPPLGRLTDKSTKSYKDLKNMSSDKEKMTDHFIPILPQLLNKFMGDQCNILNLLQIPFYFDLSLFLVSSENARVLSLLNVVQDIFLKYNDSDVLETCVKLFDHLKNEAYPLFSLCESFSSSVVDLVVQKLNSVMTYWSENEVGCNDIDEDIEYSLIGSMKKVSVLYSLINMNMWGLWKLIFENLEKKAVEGNLNYPDKFIKHALRTCYYHILWSLNVFEEKKEAKEDASESFGELKANFSSFMKFAEYILKNTPGLCAEEAYKIFCDLLLIFKTSNNFSHFYDGFISYPSSKIRDLLFGYLQNYVLNDCDSNNVEKIYKERILISSYCKLITYRILPVFFITDILVYYEPTYSNFGDIIDVTMTSAKDDKVDFARAVLSTLIHDFEEINKGSQNLEPPKDITSLKKLAKKFSSVLGVERRNDMFCKAIHMDGIIFALRGIESNLPILDIDFSNLKFFDVLVEFSSKLNKNNKSLILDYLKEKGLPEAEINSVEDWQSYFIYKKSLIH